MRLESPCAGPFLVVAQFENARFRDFEVNS